ncbi:MAG: alpha/beta fold hydrolase [Acidimicrobiales bacterium]
MHPIAVHQAEPAAGAPPGVTPALCLHGLGGGFAATFTDSGWTIALARRRLVVGIDSRGFGDAAPPGDPSELTGRPYVGDVLGALDALGLAVVDVIGFSMGAGQAIRLALDAPERVRRLVLLGVDAPALAAAGDTPGPVAEGRALLTLAHAKARPTLGPQADLQFEAWARDPLAPFLWRSLGRPALFVTGGNDADGAGAAMAVADVLAQRLDGARHHLVMGADHASTMRAAGALGAALEFLDGL